MGIPHIRELYGLELKYFDLAHTSVLDTLWNAVMGSKTLVDLVAGIFTGMTSALAILQQA